MTSKVNEYKNMMKKLDEALVLGEYLQQFIWGNIAKIIPGELSKDICEAVIRSLREEYQDAKVGVIYPWEEENHVNKIDNYNGLLSLGPTQNPLNRTEEYPIGLEWNILLHEGTKEDQRSVAEVLTYLVNDFIPDCADFIIKATDSNMHTPKKGEARSKLTAQLAHILDLLETV